MENRLNIVSELMNLICINNNYSVNLLNQLEYFKDIHCISNYIINIHKSNNIDFNPILEEYFCKNIQDIILNEIDINFFIPTFYDDKLNSKFISNKIKINIINNLFIKTSLKFKNRNITIFSKKNIKKDFIKKIDSIFNFFDILTKNINYYNLFIYLSDEIKLINYDNEYINPDNINSGLTNKVYICIFRKEEIFKVLFHEIIHYLDLDIYFYNNELRYLYKDIELNNSITNPNEGYTEALTIILITIWKYIYFENNFKINEYFNYSLNLELYWSFYQISKIIKFFKCYDTYEDLFKNKKCIFKQKTNVLSYFILKSYLLFNCNTYFKNIKINNFDKRIDLFNSIDLLDLNFSNNVNKILNNFNIKDNSLRMSIQF